MGEQLVSSSSTGYSTTSGGRVSGGRLRAARTAAGLSQSWVARRLGISQPAVSCREKGSVAADVAEAHLAVIPEPQPARVSIRRSNYYTGKRLVDLIAGRL